MQDSIASIIYHLGLDIEDICLYYYIIRKSEDDKLEISAANIGKDLGLSQCTVIKRVKRLSTPHELLNGKSLITLKRESGSKPFTHYITDISKENEEFFMNDSK